MGPVRAQSGNRPDGHPMAQARGLAGLPAARDADGPDEGREIAPPGYSIPNERFVLGTMA